MTATATLTRALQQCPLIAILRAPTGDHLDAVIDTLVEAGVKALEVTLPTPGSLAAIRRAASRHPGTLVVGAGTVLTPDQVDRVAEVGGHFVVSPNTVPAVIGATITRGMGSLPGAFTPTEICAALSAGATAVKIFPAGALGPSYVSDVLAPLPHARLIPVGGVGEADVGRYLDAGAVAVGIGSPLLGTALVDGDTSSLAARAERFVRAAQRPESA